jgi:hypothetical protein
MFFAPFIQDGDSCSPHVFLYFSSGSLLKQHFKIITTPPFARQNPLLTGLVPTEVEILMINLLKSFLKDTVRTIIA